jgi:chromate reductase
VLILGIAGSFRRGSYNRLLLEAAGRHVPAAWRFEILEGLEELPAYDEGLDGSQAPVSAGWLRAALGVADAVLLATPEYNGSLPGGLKNVLDWASRPFPDNCLRHKPTAVVSASTGVFGAITAQAELRKVLTTIGAHVVESSLALPAAHRAFTADGRLRDPALDAALATVVGDLTGRIARRAA